MPSDIVVKIPSKRMFCGRRTTIYETRWEVATQRLHRLGRRRCDWD